MALVKEPFVDTSVLLGGLIEMGPESRPAQRVMTAIAAGRVGRPRTAWHCCLEFYAVSTRLPEELRLAPAAARQLVEEEILGRFQVLQLGERSWLPFLRSSALGGIAGGRLYDAHIAEVARRGGCRLIVTDNIRHFAALGGQGVRVVSAADYAAELS